MTSRPPPKDQASELTAADHKPTVSAQPYAAYRTGVLVQRRQGPAAARLP